MNRVPGVDALLTHRGTELPDSSHGCSIFQAKHILLYITARGRMYLNQIWFTFTIRHYTGHICQTINHVRTFVLSFVFERRWALFCAGWSLCRGL